MASLYSSLCSEGDMQFPTYKFGSPELATNQVYLNQSCVPISYTNSSDDLPQYHALSLTLGGSEEAPFVQLHSDLSQFTNSSDPFDPLLIQDNDHIKNVEYLSFNLAGNNQDATVKYGGENSPNSSKGITSFIHFLQQQESTDTLSNSKYLKAAQDLLDELVNVYREPKLSEKTENSYTFRQEGFTRAYVEVQESNSYIGLDHDRSIAE